MVAVLVVWGSASGGCDRRGAQTRDIISQEKFVAANVALRTGDTAQDARVEALKQHGVTEDQLRAFVAAHAGDTLLAAVWDEIAKGVEAKRPEADTSTSVAPVQVAAPAPPVVPRKLPRVMQPRTRVRTAVAEKDTAGDSPATPASDSTPPP